MTGCGGGGIGEIQVREVLTGPFALLVIFAWIPLFLFFVCLTVKLTGDDTNSVDGRIRMALIFMPFWIFEGPYNSKYVKYYLIKSIFSIICASS